MNEKQQRIALFAALGLVIIAGLVFYLRPKTEPPITTDKGFYYTGVMKSKSSNTWGTADGRSVPAPEGYKETKVEGFPAFGGGAPGGEGEQTKAPDAAPADQKAGTTD